MKRGDLVIRSSLDVVTPVTATLRLYNDPAPFGRSLRSENDFTIIPGGTIGIVLEMREHEKYANYVRLLIDGRIGWTWEWLLTRVDDLRDEKQQ